MQPKNLKTCPPTSLFQIAIPPNFKFSETAFSEKMLFEKLKGIDINMTPSHPGYLELFKREGTVAVNLYLLNKSLKPKVIYGSAGMEPEWLFTNT